MTIPPKVREAYQTCRCCAAEELTRGRIANEIMEDAADAIQWAVAGWLREEWQRTHVMCDYDADKELLASGTIMRVVCREPDKHTSTDAVWLAEADRRLREPMEESKDG